MLQFQKYIDQLKLPDRILTPEEMDSICSQVIQELKNNPVFDGLILMGSYAKQTPDYCSDLDFVIVVQDQTLAQAVSKWKEFLSARTQVLAIDELAPLEWVSCLESHPAGILKIDFDFIVGNKLQESIQTAFDNKTGLFHGKILYDRSGLLKKAYTSVESSPPQIKYPSFTMDQFLIVTWSAVRMLYRGELFETYDILRTMRDPYISTLLLKLHNAPFENYRFFEKKINSAWRQKFVETHCRVEGKEMALSCIRLVDLFQDIWTRTGNTINEAHRITIDTIKKELEAYKENRLP